jgi:MATE family multidrug resistance protein
MQAMFGRWANRWEGEGGYRQLLAVAFPLILSSGAWSLQHFVDRMFLTWYSAEALAAAAPAGILNYTLMSPFIGTAGYVGTFVAQYFGAGRPERIGPSVWQGLYVSLGGAVLMAVCLPLAGPIFGLIGHAPEIGRLEAVYFGILCLGAFPAIACAALGGFYGGRGETWPVLWVNLAITAVNIGLDYLLIFGRAGFPELGIAGAAIATNLAMLAGLLLYAVLLFRADPRRKFRLLAGWRLDPELCFRLIRFGLPSGIQFFLDMAGFTLFLLIVGRLGTVSLAATNIAFNINTLAFMPMIGLGMAVSILVGQELGRNRPELAAHSVGSGLHLTLLYMGLVAFLYVAVPDLFLAPFGLYASPASYGEIRDLSVTLLRFVALYSIFDALSIIYGAALRGAGDTRFVMLLIGGLSAGVLTLPTYLVVEILGAGILAGWTVATTYVCLLGLGCWLRFRGGQWKGMRVIEPAVGTERG